LLAATPRRTALARARAALLDLLFPPRCAGCGRRGVWLCSPCLAQVSPLQPPFCRRCGRSRPGGSVTGDRCSSCREDTLRSLDWARAAYPLAGPVRAAIHRFKYEKERARAGQLGLLLPPLLADVGLTPALLLIPVPLNAARRRERGYNQAEELARVLAGAGGWTLGTGLVRTRATIPQVGLDRDARQRNVDGAFVWRGSPLEGVQIVLVDDVMTTGATADACAAALKMAGASRVGLVTVARALDVRGR